MRFLRKHSSSILGLLLILGTTLGCLGPGNKTYNCEGIVTTGGKTYRGLADSKKQAELNSCNKFCLENDSEFEGMYRVWLDSAAGKRLAERRKRKPTKEEAIMENKRLLDYITKNCANRCVREAGKGKHTLDVQCKK